MYGYSEEKFCPVMSYRRDNLTHVLCDEKRCQFYDAKRGKCIIFALLDAKISNLDCKNNHCGMINLSNIVDEIKNERGN